MWGISWGPHPHYSCSVVSDSFVTPRTVACQAPLSMEFSRQEYWSGLPFPSPQYLPNPGTEPTSPALQADSLLPEPPGKPTYIASKAQFQGESDQGPLIGSAP